MTGRVAGKVALVIGAARGIGAAIAGRLAKEGAVLVVADREATLGMETAARLGGTFVRCDVGEPADIAAAVGGTVESHGRLDILVQNAGIFPMSDIVDMPIEEWDDVLRVNLRGSFLATQAALRVMLPQQSGRIVLTSSITGPKVTQGAHAHYASSKAGMIGLIRSAALEAAPSGVTVNGIEPGNIMTEGMRAERSPAYIDAMAAAIPMGKLGTPGDVANAALFLASDEAGFITGTTIVVDGGQILPESKS